MKENSIALNPRRRFLEIVPEQPVSGFGQELERAYARGKCGPHCGLPMPERSARRADRYHAAQARRF